MPNRHEAHEFHSLTGMGACTTCGLPADAEIHWLSRLQSSVIDTSSLLAMDPSLFKIDHERASRWAAEDDHHHERAESNDSPLRRWWTDQAFDEADRTISKMEEYGSMDLVHIGHAMWDVMGRTTKLSDVAAMELGCLFYVYGKVQRAMSAVKVDRPILDDTWFDMHIYAKMAQAARAGVWPL